MKGRFVQSSFRLFVDAMTPDVVEAACDADKLIDWGNVLRVDLLCNEQPKCPICLEEDVVVPKITKCGHVFCMSCFMRYILIMSQDNGKHIQRCPVCKADVELNDLVSVRFQMTRAVQVGDRTSFILANHEKSSTIMRVPDPADVLGQEVSSIRDHHLTLPTEQDVGWYFSRFVHMERSEFARILSREVEGLQYYRRHKLRAREIELLPSIDAAVTFLKAQRGGLHEESDTCDPCESRGKPSHMTSVDSSCYYVCVPSNVAELFGISFAAYSDKFPEASAQHDSNDAIDVSVLFPELQDEADKHLMEGQTEIKVDADVESDCAKTTSSSNLLLVEPQKLLEADIAPHIMSLYQMIDGSLVFLDPFFTKLLLQEHGGYSSLPTVLQDVQIERLSELSITAYIRRKHRFLAHLPLGSQVALVEIDLRSHLSRETKVLFAEEFMQRKELQKTEERQSRREAKHMSARAAAAEKQFYQSLNIRQPFQPASAASSSATAVDPADEEEESSEWEHHVEPIEDQVSEVLSKALRSQAESGGTQTSGGAKKKKGRAAKATKVRLFG